MPFYARTAGWRARQIAADLFVLLWSVGWWFVGQVLAGLIRALAQAAETTAAASTDAYDRLTEIATVAGSVPLVGDSLASPFTDLAALALSLSSATGGQVDTLQGVATATGWLTFLVPVALILLVWLPRRITFVRNSRALLAIAERPGSQDLLALRALATLRPTELATVGGDPAAAWRAQDPAALATLAQLALVDAGVARRRATTPA